MTVKNLLVLFLSVICISACSKKEDDNKESESSSPIMAIVDEAPPEALQAPLRDPLQNIVVNTDNNINADAAQNQNLAGDIPTGYISGPTGLDIDPHFANPMDRVVSGGKAVAIAPDNGNVTRTPDGGYSATATAPTLKDAAAGGGRI